MRKNIPPDHKSVSLSLKILINVITFLCPDSKTVLFLENSVIFWLYLLNFQCVASNSA